MIIVIMSLYNYKRYSDLHPSFVGGLPLKRPRVDLPMSYYKGGDTYNRRTYNVRLHRTINKLMRSVERGSYKGKFKKGKKKAVSNVKYPCVVKDERIVEATDPNTGYMLHITHPPRLCLRMIGMCMVQKFFERAGIKIQNWNDFVPTMYFSGTPSNPFDRDWETVEEDG